MFCMRTLNTLCASFTTFYFCSSRRESENERIIDNKTEELYNKKYPSIYYSLLARHTPSLQSSAAFHNSPLSQKRKKEKEESVYA